MVTRRRHGTDTISTSGQTVSNSSLQQTLSIASIINTLEEGKCCWIRRCGRVETANILDGDMDVANNLTGGVKSLWCCVVCASSIGKGTGLEVGDLQ